MQSNSETGSEAELDRYRFDWGELPAITTGLPGTGGETRREPEDFRVVEMPSYLPSGEGSHAYALVEKRGLATLDVVKALRDRGVPERAVGFAGRKDKHAVTRQWFSVREEYEEELHSLIDVEGISILEKSRHTNKLGLGHLRANQFEIRVRNPVPDWERISSAVLERIASFGLPNYFGPQRFGSFNDNAIEAVRLARGESRAGTRRSYRFYLSALQSHVFNHLVKARIERGLYGRVLTGDWAQRHDSGGMFVVEDGEVESPRAERLEISAVLPLFGKKARLSNEGAGELEREVLEDSRLTWDDFKTLTGARRVSRIIPWDVSLEATEDGYVAKFTLPKGSFATCLLRELLKDAGSTE
ncbi:MAG: tRNA pseudouridine(13) synthase TruD [Chloroflexi bacterium]|nr:tRNA pseudouridine(13) synthase TruD [Chloroflexota bacterium]